MISKRKKIIYTIILGLSVVIFSLAKYAEVAFGGAQTAEIIFTILLPAGTSLGVFLNGLLFCLTYSLKLGFIVLVPFYLLFNNIKKFPFKGLYTFIISLSLIIYAMCSIGLPEYIYNMLSPSDFIFDNYVDPKKVQITFPNNKKNLIYILVESLEADYDDVTINNKKINLIPNLTNFAEDNINFSSNNNLGGFKTYPFSNWTTAGTVAQMAGIPLLVRPSFHDYGYHDKFLNNVTMLGDILKENGYQNYHLSGSNAEFGGMKDLFLNHGFEVNDYNYMKEKGLIPSDYYVFWGFEDYKLYNFAKQKLEDISKSDSPFSLVISTIDTHPIDGYLDEKTCKDSLNYHYGSSILCADKYLNDFIKWIKEQSFYDNTVIVITGDHLSMQTDIENYLNNENREVFNLFINTDKEKEYIKNRQISPFDMFPTILSSLGVDVEGHRLGLGTDLFSGEETLTEKYGYDYMIKNLKKYSPFYFKNFV